GNSAREYSHRRESKNSWCCRWWTLRSSLTTNCGSRKKFQKNAKFPEILAPAVGFEPTTNRLTADRSTTELRWISLGDAEHTLASPFVQGKRRFGTKEKLLTQHSSKKLVAGAGFEPATFRL